MSDELLPIACRLPQLMRGQQVIDRRTGETWRAVGWTPDLELRVSRHGLVCTHRIPWADVAAAALPPLFWANRIGARLRARCNGLGAR